MSSHLHKLRVTKARPNKYNAIIEVCQAFSNGGLGESRHRESHQYGLHGGFRHRPTHLSDLC